MPYHSKNRYHGILSGLLPWTTFQTAIMGGTQSVVNNAQLIKKVYFPREIIPLSIVLSSFVNYLITLIILFAGIFIAKKGEVIVMDDFYYRANINFK